MYIDLDRAWSAYCVTIAILGVFCLVQTALNMPREVWAIAVATDAQGFEIELPVDLRQPAAIGRD